MPISIRWNRGKRIEYTYSPTERYERIYLNEQLYTWHCLDGSEKGLADTDRCDYRKIAEDLYLFVWREKIVPTLGIVLLDLAQLKTTGQILGYQGFDFAAVTSFSASGRVRASICGGGCSRMCAWLVTGAGHGALLPECRMPI